MISSCNKSKSDIKPAQDHHYVIDLSSIKMQATLDSEILEVTITNTSAQSITIDKPWFGPCSTIYVYGLKTKSTLNPLGSAIGNNHTQLDSGASIVVKIPTINKEDDSYRVIYKPYFGYQYDTNQVECISISKKK